MLQNRTTEIFVFCQIGELRIHIDRIDLLLLAAASGCPIVASNDVRFLRREDFEAHEARVCIQQSRVLSDKDRPRGYSEQQYLRTEAEMVD